MGTSCEECGKEVIMPFKCPFCKGVFCAEHRLPENHTCLHTPKRTPLGNWKIKARYKETRRKRQAFEIRLIVALIIIIIIIAILMLLSTI